MQAMRNLPVALSCRRLAALPNNPNQRHLARTLPHQEGRIAIVTNVEAGCGGREMSQRLIARTNDIFADGQAAWS